MKGGRFRILPSAFPLPHSAFRIFLTLFLIFSILPAEGSTWEKLADLRSFCFTLQYHSEVPVVIRAQLKGKWQAPDKEEWNGFFERDGKKEKIHLFASDVREFELTRSGWQVRPRGLETRILEQIQQVFLGETLEFIREERGKYLYRFKPNLPLIDPQGIKGLKGIVEVDRHSKLPVRIYCADENKKSEWELRLFPNRAGLVKIPFVPVLQVLLLSPDYRWTCGERRKAAGIIKQRLKEMGVDFRMKWGRTGVDLAIDRRITHQGLKLLFSSGRVEIWTGKIVSDSEDPKLKTLPVGGDEAKKVCLGTLLGDNGSLYAEADLDLPAEPRLRVRYKEHPAWRIPESDTGVIVLIIDGVAIGIGKPGTDDGFIFTDIGSKENVWIIAALTNHPPLTRKFDVTIKKTAE